MYKGTLEDLHKAWKTFAEDKSDSLEAKDKKMKGGLTLLHSTVCRQAHMLRNRFLLCSHPDVSNLPEE